LQAFVLSGRNHAPGYQGTEIIWDELNEALKATKTPVSKDEKSLFQQAIHRALSEDGMISQWEALAQRTVDPQTSAVTYMNPAYEDLADYAARYSRSIEH
jgi:hypothetical protein